MRMLVAMVLGLLIAPAVSAQGLPPCHTDARAHHRWTLKTRPAASITIADRLSVASLVAWDVPTAARSEETIDVRERGIYGLTGYVRLAKRSADDCDVHLQLADAATGAGPEVIVEIPPTDPALQAAVAQFLGGIHTTPRRFSGADAIRVAVTGYAFVDQEHATKIPSKKGHAHGTADVASLWEIHPVLTVERAK